MPPRLLLDTHILIRWLTDKRKLSQEQFRTLETAVKRTEPVALCGTSLLEIAMLTREGRLKLSLTEFFDDVQADPVFRILPITFEIALEVSSLGPALRDPADRVIVATARVHRLRLVTSDQRIIDSKLVPVVE